jgi:CelD/BcsL family acetyltransferase involved in cellulose biosynthesis
MAHMGIELEPLGTLAGTRSEWDAAAGRAGNPFATFDWVDAWWTHLAPRGELLVRRMRAPDGRVVGLLPLYAQRRGPVTLIRFLGHGPAAQLGPLCEPADLPLAAAGLRRTVAELGPGGLLLAERLASESALAPRLRGGAVRSESSPLLPIEGRTYDAWLASRSSNFRSQARRMERRLAREHRLEFRFADDPATLSGHFDELVRLHHLRWGDESKAFTPAREAFHRDFAARALAQGRLRLCFAVVDDRPAAAYYGLRHAGVEWYYQLGRDPRWDEYRVGFVLLMRMIRGAFDDGLSAFRFGVGDEPYKQRVAAADPGVDTVLMSHAPVARLAPHVAAGARRLPPGFRRPVMRALGW